MFTEAPGATAPPRCEPNENDVDFPERGKTDTLQENASNPVVEHTGNF
jgi:hypothetical protein